jgi:hypothetical protein
MLVSGLEFSGGSEREIAFAGTNCTSGDTNVQIRTYNAAGTSADRGFQFIAYRAGGTQIVPTSAPPPGATQCTLDSAGTLTCV